MASSSASILAANGWTIFKSAPSANCFLYKKSNQYGILTNDVTWLPIGTGNATVKDAILAYLPVLIGCSFGMGMTGSDVEALFDSLP
jgi:hypothetical protein